MWSIMTSFEGRNFLPLKTCVAQRACNSDSGKIAPAGWTQPITARVGLERFGVNTYLYKSTLLSLTGRIDWSIHLNPVLYPVQNMTTSTSHNSEPSSKTTPVLVKWLTFGLTTMLPVIMRCGRSSLIIPCWLKSECCGRTENTSWSNLEFKALVKKNSATFIGKRLMNLVNTAWSRGSPPSHIRDRTQAPRRVLR